MSYPSTVFEYLIASILNNYSEKTNMPIGFINKLQHIGIIWQLEKKYCSPVCKMLHDLDPHFCDADHNKRCDNPNQIKMCHAGLWDIIIPIDNMHETGRKITDILDFSSNDKGDVNRNVRIGLLITGQSRIFDESEKSDRRFEKFKTEIKKLLIGRYEEIIHSLYDESLTIDQKIDRWLDELTIAYKNTQILKRENFTISQNEILSRFQNQILNAILININERQKITSVSHDITLPIASIVASVGNLDKKEYNDGTTDDPEDIIRVCRKLTKIAYTLSYGLRSFNQQSHKLELINIKEVISENIDIFKSEAKIKKGLEFKLLTLINGKKYEGSDIYTLYGSKDHIDIIFFNVIHNAIKYSYSSMENISRYIKILINYNTETKKFNIRIENYGTGILKKELKDIYKEGVRGILSKDRERTGSGIGLSIVKNVVVNQHKGEVNITSIKKGESELKSPYLTTTELILYKYLKEVETKDGIISFEIDFNPFNTIPPVG
jgi:signal transduction histidine kinase